jgi:hypothetical protein
VNLADGDSPRSISPLHKPRPKITDFEGLRGFEQLAHAHGGEVGCAAELLRFWMIERSSSSRGKTIRRIAGL